MKRVKIKKFVAILLLLVFTACITVGAFLSVTGYTMYCAALDSTSVKQVTERIRGRPDFTKLEEMPHRHAPQKRLFQGVLVCADCGAILSGIGFPKTYKGKRSVSISYRCGAYHATCGSVCSKHHISENALKQVVLGHIHRLAEKIALDEHIMLEALLSRLVGRETASKAEKARERRALKNRLRQLEGQTTRLYEDHVAGSLAGDSFSETLARYEAERLEKESRLSLLEQSAQEKAAKLADIKTWMRLIREKASIEDVDRELLDALVERIEVGEPSMVNGEKSQDVRIVFKLVGYMGGEMDG